MNRVLQPRPLIVLPQGHCRSCSVSANRKVGEVKSKRYDSMRRHSVKNNGSSHPVTVYSAEMVCVRETTLRPV